MSHSNLSYNDDYDPFPMRPPPPPVTFKQPVTPTHEHIETFFQPSELPPPYFASQHQPESFANSVLPRTLDLLTEPFKDLEQFFIKKSGKTTRFAADSGNHQLFSYSERVIAKTSQVLIAKLYILNNDGTEIVRGEMDLSGTRVMSGDKQLGVLDPIKGDSSCSSGFSGSSTLGLGNIQFIQRGCHPLASLCLCFCRRCSSFDKTYDITCNKEGIGELTAKRGSGVGVVFKKELDPRLKAVIVVGSFMMFNAHWQHGY